MSTLVERFEAELKQIKHPVIKEFAVYVLGKAPQYLPLVPSSSTAKYHPPQSNVEPGGLLNHMAATVEFGLTFGRAFDLHADEQDAVTAACLLHDMLKYSDFERGVEVKQKYTTKTHDYDSAIFVHKAAKMWKEETGKDVPLLSVITGAIAWHMGRWTIRKNPAHTIKKFPEDYSKAEIVVHLADMAAANKNVHMLNVDVSLVG